MCLCEAAGIWAMDRRKPIVFMLESGQVEGVNRILLCVQTGVCAELMPRLLHSASAEPGCWQQHGCAVSSGHHHSLPPFSLCRHTYSRYKYLEDGSLFFSKTKLLRTLLQPAPNIKSPQKTAGIKNGSVQRILMSRLGFCCSQAEVRLCFSVALRPEVLKVMSLCERMQWSTVYTKTWTVGTFVTLETLENPFISCRCVNLLTYSALHKSSNPF